MHRSTPAIFLALFTVTLCLPIFLAQAADLDELRYLEERLTTLEQEAADLRSDIEIIKARVGVDPTYDSEQNISTAIIGTWECTNNVFTYELSLMQNGMVITKEMSSGRTMQGKWLRRGKDDIVISNPGYRGGGAAKSFRLVDISDNRMSLEEPNAQSIYDCDRLSQE